MKRINIALFILWLGIINEAFILNLKTDDEIRESLDEKVQNNVLNENGEEIQDVLEKAENSVKTMIQSEPLDENTKMIRVLLMNSEYQSYYHPSVTVEYDGKEEVYSLESEMLKNGDVIIECDSEGITISSINRQQGTPTYQGTIEIRKTDDGLLLINELPVEKYLEAVVPSEMPSSYEKDALKAQAVCARTYAYKQIEKKSLEKYNADVDDSVNYQVYENLSRQERTSEAVHETEGKVLTQDGELIEAYYFSTSSGMTSTDEVWGVKETASYLKSVTCEFDSQEKWSEWNVMIPWENIEENFYKMKNIRTDLVNIQLNRKSESGAVIEMFVVTESGNETISGEYDIRSFLAPKECEITVHDGTKINGGSLLPSAYFDIELENGNYVQVYGRGYGHGVGMSQNAADEMAKKGYAWEDILKYFFENVEIKEYADYMIEKASEK